MSVSHPAWSDSSEIIDTVLSKQTGSMLRFTRCVVADQLIAAAAALPCPALPGTGCFH